MKTLINNTRSGKQASGIGVLMACGDHSITGLAFTQNIMEEWKDVPELTGNRKTYQVSNYGRMRSITIKSGSIKYLNSHDPNGYAIIASIKKGTKLVHRYVGKAFIPNPDNKPFINHKDSNTGNNHIENLEWCTHRENINHGYKTGLSLDVNLHLLSFTGFPADLERLKEIARKEDTTVSRLIRKAITEFIKTQKP